MHLVESLPMLEIIWVTHLSLLPALLGLKTVFSQGKVEPVCARNVHILMLYYFLCYLQSDAGWEEYYDYIFPTDEANQPNLKLLAMAKMWKQKREQGNSEGEEDDEEEGKEEESSDEEEEKKEIKMEKRKTDSDSESSDSDSSGSDSEEEKDGKNAKENDKDLNRDDSSTSSSSSSSDEES